MSILITGGMGHVGYELIKQALRAGEDVIAQYHTTFRKKDADALVGNVRWVHCNLSNPADVEAMSKDPNVTGCIHTAAVPNDMVARNNPGESIMVNIGAVGSLLEAARLYKWTRFIYVSTGSVFQNVTNFNAPIFEDAIPFTTNTYSTTKLSGEVLTNLYRTQFNVSAASIRISWVYGPPLVPVLRQNPRGPIPLFLKYALAGIPIKELRGGDFAASYTYVADVAAGLFAAYKTDNLNNGIYHLGSGANYSTHDVAAAVKEAVPGSIISIGAGTEPWTDDTRMRGPLAGDNLFKDTGFKPHYSLSEGVKDFANWMRSNPETFKV